MSTRVALVSGFWGHNIGNAFFNIGGKYILDEVFGGGVEFIQDQPGYRTFHDQRTGNPKNDLQLLRYLDVDYMVLQGPMLTVNFPALWEPTFRSLAARGTKIVLLGAAMFRFTKEEVETNRRFLNQYPPHIISTRDHPSYEAFKDCAPYTYSGIDSAFFVPDAYRPHRLMLDPYVVLNFDRKPEPNIRTAPGEGSLPDSWPVTFDALGMRWGLKFPHLQSFFAARGKAQAYVGAYLDRRRLPEAIGDYLVVRTEHRVNPHITWKVYRQPNAVASDEPFTYFTLYSGSTLTLSDRVHACVATLAYGNPAMLFSSSRRGQLFDRLGLEDIRHRPVTLDPERLAREKESLMGFMRGALNGGSWDSVLVEHRSATMLRRTSK